MGLNFDWPTGPQVVTYMDLGGGLNTRLDPHALARNELAVSINLWPTYDSAIAKRPGVTQLAGTVGGGGGAALSLSSARFNGVTYFIKLAVDNNLYARNADTADTWHLLGAASPFATFITTAQMMDPASPTVNSVVFICDGFSIPKIWKGPSSFTLTPVLTTATHLPSKYNQPGVPITPQFVMCMGQNSYLVYSGDSANTSAVYISDPLQPQNFNTPAMLAVSEPPIGSFIPALIANNDGAFGGPITGIATIGGAIIVFKEAAIYTMTQVTLLGEDTTWQVQEIASSTGCQSPRSIASFPNFIAFVGIDGAYITDGVTCQQISGDVATYFDASLTGFPALITNRQLTLGTRHGMRYLIWFCTSGFTYATTGLWFDFTKESRFGNPIAGQISGLTPGGVVSLRSQGDDGNVGFVDSQTGREGIFGQGHADWGGPISTMFLGKADLYDDVFGPEAAVSVKQCQDAYLLVALLNQSSSSQVDFFGSVVVDIAASLGRVLPDLITTALTGGIWGTGLWGSMIWGPTQSNFFSLVKVPLQNNAQGYLLQVGMKETSTVPWVITGYATYVNLQKTGY